VPRLPQGDDGPVAGWVSQGEPIRRWPSYPHEEPLCPVARGARGRDRSRVPQAEGFEVRCHPGAPEPPDSTRARPVRAAPRRRRSRRLGERAARRPERAQEALLEDDPLWPEAPSLNAGLLVALLSCRDSSHGWAVAKALRFPPPWKADWPCHRPRQNAHGLSLRPHVTRVCRLQVCLLSYGLQTDCTVPTM